MKFMNLFLLILKLVITSDELSNQCISSSEFENKYNFPDQQEFMKKFVDENKLFPSE